MTKALGIIWLDETNGLGLQPNYDEPFATSTVLDSTLLRLRHCQTVTDWLCLCANDVVANRHRHRLPGGWHLEIAQQPLPAWTPILRQSRKWSLDGWRGGIQRSTVFEEECHPAEFARLAKQFHADWVVQVRAESPVVDPGLVDSLVSRAFTFQPPPPFVYGNIPPGLSGYVYRTAFLQELAEQGLFPGLICGYRAWEPTIELPEQPFAFKPVAAVSQIPVRLLADNDRSLTLLRQLAESAGVSSLETAENVAHALADHPALLVPEAPVEVEVEWTTTRRTYPRFLPRVDRPNMDVSCFRELIAEYRTLAPLSLVTIGGHGDPLHHPEWEAMLDAADGVYGLALQTDALSLTAEVTERLLDRRLDVVSVALDAATERTYRQLHGSNEFAQAVTNIERFLDSRHAHGGFGPRLVVTMVRCQATLDELDDFYDTWSSRADAAVILGHSDFAGQMPAEDVLNLCPPNRRPCVRLQRRMMIHSDGSIVSCSEDFSGTQHAGRFPQTSLHQAWNQAFHSWRELHQTGRWTEMPVCPTCREWHRR